MDNNKKQKSETIKIKSIEANSIYLLNTYDAKLPEEKKDEKRPYLDMGKAVLNKSLFTEYMMDHGMTVSKRGNSKDFIVMKFNYGVKGGMSSKELREYYYEYGAVVKLPTFNKDGIIIREETITYKMLMRNPGKAKDGECIFVKEDLHNVALKYITMDLWDKMPLNNAKIVEMSAYAPLTTATAIGYIKIPMENIFIVEDKDVLAMIKAFSVKAKDVQYERKVIDWIATEDYINKYGFTFYKKKKKDNPQLKYIKKTKSDLKNSGINIDDCPKKVEEYYRKECYVDRTNVKTNVKNTLWDGMGLIDEFIFPQNMEGFIYCRSHFFKSCLFRGNIQDYFKDFYGDNYETATVKDMFGNVFKVKDIKVIITQNSIKWIKFTDLMGGSDISAYKYYRNFMKKHNEKFAIVKTAHKSKWGELQRSSYQMNNSLPCTDKEILKRIAKVSIDYCNALKISHEAFIKHLKINASQRYSINNVLAALDEWNDNFKYTEYFKEKKKKIISNFKNDRLKLGKLLQYGDNLTICGNPIALLMIVTGQDCLKEGCFEKMDNAIQCYTTRFKDGERLAGFRSPHNSPNNIVHLVNIHSDLIKHYFPKLGHNVIIINGIETDVQDRLNGQDLDTDSIYATNQPDIVQLAKYAYLNYPTIINDIPLKGNSIYKKDMRSYADMDNNISAAQYAIGYASNIAQLALSYYYDSVIRSEELEDVFIICSVLAQVAIDSAKRAYDINFNSELRRLGDLSCMQFEDGKKYPIFYAENQKEKKNYNIQSKEIRRFDCPMEILAEIIEDGIIDLRKHKEFETETKPLSVVFQCNKTEDKKYKQFKKIISSLQEYNKKVNSLDKTKWNYTEKVNLEFDECMKRINKISLNKTTMSALIDYAFQSNGDVRDRLLVALYDMDSDKFLECFKKYKGDTKIA